MGEKKVIGPLTKTHVLWILGAVVVGLVLGVVTTNPLGLDFSKIGAGGTGALTGSATGTGQGTQPQTLLTGNPAIVFTVLDEKTQQVENEATIRLLDSSGSLRAVATTTSGTATFSNLDPNQQYRAEVIPSVGTAFYATTANVTSPSAGSKTQVLTYKSVNNNAPTVSVYNFDGLTANSTAQSIVANDSGTFRIRFRPPTSLKDNNNFGDGVVPLVFVIDYNSVAYKAISMKGSDNVSTLQSTGIPAGHTTPDKNRSSAVAFLANVNSLQPATDYDFYISVQSSTQDPTNTLDSNCGLKITVLDGARYQTNAGQYIEGYTNQDSLADLGASNYLGYANCS